jgi:hypothetical protein
VRVVGMQAGTAGVRSYTFPLRGLQLIGCVPLQVGVQCEEVCLPDHIFMCVRLMMRSGRGGRGGPMRGGRGRGRGV